MDDHTITADASQFYHCLEDNFFTKHVNVCTQDDAILDLVISYEPNAVRSITDLGPVASSDHSALSWNLEVPTTPCPEKKVPLIFWL